MNPVSTASKDVNITKNERIEWVDALKGFAIFCVTLGHLNMWYPIEKYIYSFHMFLFFFLSGFLFSVKQPTKVMIKKRMERILIPFISWNIVSAIAGYVLMERDVANFIQELFVINGNLTYNAPIWFLLVLFIAETIILILKLYKHKWVTALTIVACGALWIAIGHTWLLWKLNLVPMAMCFFLLGYLLKPFITKINKWYVIIPAGLISVVFALLNVRIMYTYGSFGNYLYCIPAAVAGVLFFVGLFSRVPLFSRLTFLKIWGKNSLMIMATQFFLFFVISIVSEKLLKFDLIDYQSSLVSFVLAVLITAIISAVTTLYKRMTKNSPFFTRIGAIFGIQ